MLVSPCKHKFLLGPSCGQIFLTSFSLTPPKDFFFAPVQGEAWHGFPYQEVLVKIRHAIFWTRALDKQNYHIMNLNVWTFTTRNYEISGAHRPNYSLTRANKICQEKLLSKYWKRIVVNEWHSEMITSRVRCYTVSAWSDLLDTSGLQVNVKSHIWWEIGKAPSIITKSASSHVITFIRTNFPIGYPNLNFLMLNNNVKKIYR